MSAVDGFTWLKHSETGGTFRCPDEAVEDWAKNGWEPCEAPEEVNPAIAERIAFERAQQAAAEAAAPDQAADAAPQTTTTTKPRRGDSQEMSNG